jgi:hypothetical protein
MNLKSDLPEYGHSYYWKKNRFVVFNRGGKPYLDYLLSLDNLYFVQDFENGPILYFDPESSFYCIYDSSYKDVVSQYHVVKYAYHHYQPFDISLIGENKLIIHFYAFTGKRQYQERTLVFLVGKDKLKQDLEVFIESK